MLWWICSWQLNPSATINVSGASFKIKASHLHGDGFSQYGSAYYKAGEDPTKVPGHAVAAAAIKSATLTNMCQSVVQPLPWGGTVTLLITAGGGSTPATATDLLIGMDFLSGDATFHSIDIGTDASTSASAALAAGRNVCGRLVVLTTVYIPRW